MRRGVVYLVLGQGFVLPCVCSLWHLRKHYAGDVAVITDMKDFAPPDCEMVRVTGGKTHWENLGFKPEVCRLMPFDEAIFLDCDTVVLGDIGPVFPSTGELVVTQNMKATTNNGIRRRLLGSGFDFDRGLIARRIAEGWPAINTGVLGLVKDASYYARWAELTSKRLAAGDQWTSDEIALQLIYPDHPHRVLPARYNAVNRYTADPIIRHYQGYAKGGFRGIEKHVPEFDLILASLLPAILDAPPPDPGQ